MSALGESETLYEKGGWLYVKCIIANWSKPERYIHYWPIGVTMYDLGQRVGSTEEAQSRIGMKMTSRGNGVFLDEKFLGYRLREGGQTQPEWSETEAVPPPIQRGRKLVIAWREGRWFKETSKGWKRA